MFSNQISSRDLFAGKQSNTQDTGYYGDVNRDFSQLQNSQFTQFELSQQCSQELSSQPEQYSTGSESQGRKLPSYEKYMSKPSLFRANSQNRIPVNRSNNTVLPTQPRKPPVPSSYQEQLSIYKGKAVERDERDMLSSIVSIVKECSDEVKQNLNTLRDADRNKETELKSSIKHLTTSVEDYSQKVVNAIQTRDDHNSQIVALQRQLKQKDDRIESLVQQVVDMREKDHSETILDALKAFLSQQHTLAEQKLQKVLETSQEQLKLVKNLESCQRTGQEENNKHYQDVKYTGHRHIQDLEKRLLDELIQLRDDIERQKRDSESFYRSQLHTLQQKHIRDLEKHIHTGIESSMRQVRESSDDGDVHSKLKELCHRQRLDLEKFIKFQTTEQSRQLIKQNQDIHSKKQTELQKGLHKMLDDMTSQQDYFIQESKKQFEEFQKVSQDVCAKPWQNDNVPKVIQNQLDELHSKHTAEIKRLEAEMKNQRENERKAIEQKEIENKKKSKEQVFSNQNVYDLENDELERNSRGTGNNDRTGPIFKKGPGFLSPRPPQGTVWNSRSLFGRTNPSPVAKVLPQRNITEDKSNIGRVHHSGVGQDADRTNTGRVQHSSMGLEFPTSQPAASISSRQLRSRSVQSVAPTNQAVRNNAPQTDIQDQCRSLLNRSEQSSQLGNAVVKDKYVDNSKCKTAKVDKGKKRSHSSKRQQKNHVNGRKQMLVNDDGSRDSIDGSSVAQDSIDGSSVWQESSEHTQYEAECEQSSSATSNTSLVSRNSVVEQSGAYDFSSSAQATKSYLTSKARPTSPSKDVLCNVFDFADEMSPRQPLRQKETKVMPTLSGCTRSETRTAWQSSIPDSPDNSSTNSSPSMSVTEVIIRRKVSSLSKTPENKESLAVSRSLNGLSDFLSSPTMNKLCGRDLDPRERNPSQQVQEMPGCGRRRPERRKLCDFDTQFIQLMQCSKKRRTY